MQVPATATSTAGPQNTSASASSSLLGPVAGVSTAKKGQLPAFAAILAEQSVDAGNGKNEGGVEGLTEDGNADALLEAYSSGKAHAGLKPVVLSGPPELKSSDSQSVGSASAKDETKATRHRTATAGVIVFSASGKKGNFAASDPMLASPVAAPTLPTVAQAMPRVSREAWSPAPFGASLPPNSVALEHSPGSQSQQQEPRLQLSKVGSSQPGYEEDGFSTLAEALPLAGDSAKHDLQPSQIASVMAQHAPSLEVSAASPTSEASAAIPENLRQARQVSSGADMSSQSGLEVGATNAISMLAGAETQGAAAHSNTVAELKPKTQAKSNSDAMRSPVAPASAAGASFANLARPNGEVPAIAAPARTTEAAGADVKQAAATPDTNAFQRLDAGETPATLLHSSPHQIAVGVHDPSLGWLEVQTQSSAGHISATLTAASAEAHASLAAQAPAITQYLADRNVGVHSLNVHTHAEAQSGASGGGQSQSGTGNARQEVPERGGIAVEVSRQPSLGETAEMNAPQAATASYISVRA